jgi:protein pelota
VAYGPEEIRKAIEYGAVEKLLVLDETLRKGEKAERVMSEAEKKGAEITIFEAENEPGQKLKSFGGLAAILRFPIS